jgi:hypothetical protein
MYPELLPSNPYQAQGLKVLNHGDTRDFRDYFPQKLSNTTLKEKV